MYIKATHQQVAEEDRHDDHEGNEEEVGSGEVSTVEDGLKLQFSSRLHHCLGEGTWWVQERCKSTTSIITLIPVHYFKLLALLLYGINSCEISETLIHDQVATTHTYSCTACIM